MLSRSFSRISPYVLIGFLSLTTSGVFAQGINNYRKSADDFFEKGDYYSAVLYYEKSIQAKGKSGKSGFNPYMPATPGSKTGHTTSGRDLSVYRIAESYRHLKDHINAEKWYRECLSLDTTQFPLLHLWLGMSMRANEKYSEASEQLGQFLDSYKKDDMYSQMAKLEMANCQFIDTQLKKRPRFQMNKVDGVINQLNSNYAATLVNGQWLVFTSTRTDSALLNSKHQSPYSNRLYQASISDPAAPVQKLNIPEQQGVEQGTASFTPDGKKLYFTRWTVENGRKKAMIYSSQLEGEKWSSPLPLDQSINQEGFSSQQPFVSADGQYLLFASDMPGGEGGYDLWYASIDANGSTGKATNLGKTINTTGDEQAPFYDGQAKTLLFASKGRVGMGGFDLYSATGDFTSWSEPVNPGYPFNSVKDDIYFTTKGGSSIWDEGYISTDRNSSCCLEVFHFQKIKTNKLITGLVLDCKTQKPLSGASLKLNDANGWSLDLHSDDNGNFQFEIPDYKAMAVVASKTRYEGTTMPINVPADVDLDTMASPVICLVPLPEIDTNGLSRPRNVYFDFNRSDLQKSEKKVLDSLIGILKSRPTLHLELYGYTDGKGADDYNQKLSDARVKACFYYLVENGIEPLRLVIKANGECCPVEAEQFADGADNPAARGKNRRVEFKIYGF